LCTALYESPEYGLTTLAAKADVDVAAKDASQVVYDRIMKTITPANYAAASAQIQKWKAEKETFSTMRNVGDDLN